MHTGAIPEALWAELAATAAYLRNRTPTRTNSEGKTPFELWHNNKPDVDHLRIIWSDAYAHVPKGKRSKLAPKALKFKLIGYPETKKAYRLWNPIKECIEISRDIIFDETAVLNAPPAATIIEEDEYTVEAIIGERHIDGVPQYLVKWLGYPGEDTWEPESHVKESAALEKWLNNRPQANATAQTDLPLTFKDAILGPEAPQWQEAINDELKSLHHNNTWSIVPRLPKGHNLIGCRWVFKHKLDPDGNILQYKARLVAKGFTQQYGIDYDETYAPVAKFPSIRTLLAIGNSLNMEIHQMDVKTAFLNGDLDEEIYMSVPDGITKNGTEVCKLNRTLYGLKQSPRMWNKKIDEFLVAKLQFTRLNADHGTYVRKTKSFAIIAIYVDDLLILTETLMAMTELKLELKKAFEMTDCGELHYFLGISITRDRSKRLMTLDQSHLANQVLKCHGMQDCKPISMPLNPGIKLAPRIEGERGSSNSNSKPMNEINSDPKNPEMPVDATAYRQIIGSLMFLMTGTRPDLAVAIGFLSQFNANPTNAHMQAAKRTLCFEDSKNKGITLTYSRSHCHFQNSQSLDRPWAYAMRIARRARRARRARNPNNCNNCSRNAICVMTSFLM